FVPRALERRIDLGYDGVVPEDARLRVHGQPVLAGELIRNLVDNALLYTPAGGLVTVRVVEDPFGQVVVLQVEDNGPGIAPGERDKVFQPFYRSLGSGVEGSGLGLAIVKEIVQQHDAELSLDDTRPRRAAGSEHPDAHGPGARFTIRFPAQVLTLPAP
ncbi:MAG: ATP-binding protein, partial [Rubrivivax sp.]